MPLAPPPPVTTNPITRLLDDLRAEARVTVPFPPGDTRPSMARTKAFFENPLPVVLDAYERYGPVFTLRIFHGNTVWMLGPEANHHMLVSHAQNFRWRDGHMGDLIPLLGDGLLTIDGEFHRRSRKAMLPAFHRDKIAVATQTVIDEAAPAVAQLARGGSFDLYHWTRRLALRIAMRALFGLDPDGGTRGTDMAHAFEEGLGFYARDYFLQTMRGPGTPFALRRGCSLPTRPSPRPSVPIPAAVTTAIRRAGGTRATERSCGRRGRASSAGSGACTARAASPRRPSTPRTSSSGPSCSSRSWIR